MAEGEPDTKRPRIEKGSTQPSACTSLESQRPAGGSCKESGNSRYLAAIADIWDWDELQMFHQPVDPDQVPGYYEAVKVPVDLTTMKERVQKGSYTSDEQFTNDLYTMLGNALTFNERGSRWHRHARKLRSILPKLLATRGVELNDAVYVPEQAVHDSEATLVQEEKHHAEDLSETLHGMEKDLEIPVEELMQKYRGAARQRSS